jgi:hypothetical protein
MREKFWAFWADAKRSGALLVTDCGWPVETNFLNQCINDDNERAWDGPYPLIDLSSILLAAGQDPIGEFPRYATEIPAHNPLSDARQSARVLIETLNGSKLDIRQASGRFAAL